MAPLWTAFAEVAPQQPDERDFQGGSRESLRSILRGGRPPDVEVSEMAVTVTHPTLRGVVAALPARRRPGGEVIAALDPDRRREVEQALRRNLGDGPFDITAVAWAGRGRA